MIDAYHGAGLRSRRASDPIGLPWLTEPGLAGSNARPMEMRGREMRGWLRVDAESLRTKRELATWVDLGTAYARSLPPKR